jgi:EAL and modified HD-GYP domain-containing signal transduction protein
MGVMRTLAMIQDPTADFPKLGKIIAQDTALSQKLLTLVNSLSFSLPRPVSTLEQAVAFMGLKQLRSWMTMLTLASIPGKPPELTTLAILRARMCEILAQTFGQKQSDVFFVVGLFSVLDALLDLPLIQAISGISLQTEVVDGLVNRGGAAGQVLNLALAYERGNWGYLLQTGIKPEILTSSYLNAARWATEVSSSVAEKK